MLWVAGLWILHIVASIDEMVVVVDNYEVSALCDSFMWVLGHTAGMKTMVMWVMLVPCFGNIYHAQYIWVVHLFESMIDFE